MIEYRALPVNEWEKLRVAYEACRADEPLPLPDPSQAIIISAEVSGQMVGCVGAERTWNVSPIWVDEKFRGNGLPVKLAVHIARYNTERLPELLVTTNRHVELLVFNMGFIPVAGTIWRRKP
jgi:hypothetical protein